jgi:cytochrome c biogenesis protein CcmG/thiol:disulfide interchange protein DsbE
MNARRTSMSFATVLVAATLATSAWAASKTQPPLSAGIAAPPFVAKGIGGEKLELTALLARGPVLLDFWATWCKPCVTSMPRLQGLHRELSRRGFTVVGISVDPANSVSRVPAYARKLGVTYPIVTDESGKLQRLYRPRSFPTSFLIAPNGTIAEVTEGYTTGDSDRTRFAAIKLMPAPVNPGTMMPAPADAADTLRTLPAPPTE